MCCKDVTCTKVEIATKNLYKLLKQRYGKCRWPMLLRFEVDGVTEYHFLACMVGQGSLAICVEIFVSEPVAGVKVARSREINDAPIVTTTHMVFRRLLRKAAAASSQDVVAFDAPVGVVAFAFDEYRSDGPGFAVRLRAEEFASDASTVVVAKSKKAAASNKVQLPFGFECESGNQDVAVVGDNLIPESDSEVVENDDLDGDGNLSSRDSDSDVDDDAVEPPPLAAPAMPPPAPLAPAAEAADGPAALPSPFTTGLKEWNRAATSRSIC